LRSLGESPEMITKRIALIKLTQEEAREETSNSSYLECLRRSNLRRTIISVMPLVIQALAGVSFVQGYSTYYMQLAGFSTSESYQLLVVSIALTMLGNIMSWFVVDRVGRRRLTFWGVVALTINLCIIGGLAAAGTTASVKGK
jgi:MFS transporter, SP family, general alpha glucoside:H+ symporter